MKVICKIPGMQMLMRKIFTIKSPQLGKEVFGVYFKNPVGLAAGFDKNAQYINELSNFGFGFIEIGTVTPKPQPGNPKPRLFRLKQDSALINRMGFNNDGIVEVTARLKNKKHNVIIGGNIGKNKSTLLENAIKDYKQSFEALFDHVDYFAVNISSPNTPGLRDLQDKKPLTEILSGLQTLNRTHNSPKPILVKIAPDLTNEQLDDIIEIVNETEIAGIIATNTTLSREGLNTEDEELAQINDGGLSGPPLKNRSTEIIKYIRDKAGDGCVIIGVGGIHNPDDAMEKLKAGASLVQIYTGFIYEGPSLIKRINQKLLKEL